VRKTGAGPGTGAAARVEQADVDGYAEVYRESNGQLVAYATSLTGSTWVAEDLVAEAHFRVWRRMRAGHAVDNVPAYLMTTVRNLAAGLGRARKEIARDWHELPDGAANEAVGAIGAIGTAQAQDPEQRASHVDLLARLLKELPGRWASALWYAEVEDLPLEAVGARIGASANTAGVVLARARERLRQAFLQEQPGNPLSADCEQYWKHMAAIVRGTASDRRNKLVLEHAEDCDDCRARLLALTETNERLPILLGPALLGVVLGGGALLVPMLASAGASAGTGARHARQGARAFRRARSQLLRRGASNTGRMVVGSFSAVGAVAGVAVVAVALASSSGSGHAAASAAVPTTAAPVSTSATAMAPASSPAASSVVTPTSAAATTNAAASSSAAPINAAPANTASTTPTTSAHTASSAPATTPTPSATSTSASASAPSATNTTSANAAPLASTSSGTPLGTLSSTPQNTDSSTSTPTVTPSSSSASAQPIVTPTLTPSLTPSLTPTATITPTPSATATTTTAATSTDSCDLQVLIPCVNH